MYLLEFKAKVLIFNNIYIQIKNKYINLLEIKGPECSNQFQQCIKERNKNISLVMKGKVLIFDKINR